MFNEEVNKSVSDLLWVMNSPELLSKLNGVLLVQNSPVKDNFCLVSDYNILNNYSRDISGFLSTRNTQLIGKYFESLVEFFLLKNHQFRLKAANEQILFNRQTIGEIDFLFEHNNICYHMETAGKFYLAYENKSNHENFIGPNPNDNLAKKVSHVVNSQLQLCKNESARLLLNVRGIIGEPVPLLLLKGYIFYHYNYFADKSFVMPIGANPNHNKGWWITQNELHLLPQSNYLYIVPRSEWMVPPAFKRKDELLTGELTTQLIENYFLENSYPLLVSELEYNGSEYKEVSRGFVVSGEWPLK